MDLVNINGTMQVVNMVQALDQGADITEISLISA